MTLIMTTHQVSNKTKNYRTIVILHHLDESVAVLARLFPRHPRVHEGSRLGCVDTDEYRIARHSVKPLYLSPPGDITGFPQGSYHRHYGEYPPLPTFYPLTHP